MVAACSATSTGLCHGSTSTAVPSRKVRVLAATQVKQRQARRYLAKAGEMMLDQKARVVAERLGLDVVVDELPIALAGIDIRSAVSGGGAAE